MVKFLEGSVIMRRVIYKRVQMEFLKLNLQEVNLFDRFNGFYYSLKICEFESKVLEIIK